MVGDGEVRGREGQGERRGVPRILGRCHMHGDILDILPTSYHSIVLFCFVFPSSFLALCGKKKEKIVAVRFLKCT